MIIDAHAHVGDFRWSRTDPRPPLTWDGLIRRLDDEGIDRAIFLPVYNGSPEQFPWGFLASDRMSIREQVLDTRRYADRVIPFGNMDPRWGSNAADTDFTDIIDWFREQGCRGVGEICANMPYDDPRTVNMFRQLGGKGMLVTIESSNAEWGLGFQDDPGSPRLESLLSQAPDTIVIGHGPAFWAEIVAIERPEQKKGYPRTPVTREGSLPRLLRTHPNLYADLSAASCFNALSRDVPYGIQFLNEFQDRLLFGTDVVARDYARRESERRDVELLVGEMIRTGTASDESFRRIRWHNCLMPQLPYLVALRDAGRLPREAYENIVGRNAIRLLGLA